MMMFSVIYPAGATTRFDHDYYHATHMPMVREAFTPTGLVEAQVLTGRPGPDGRPAPFVVIANLLFADAAALQATLGNERAGAVFADVANFTDTAPIIQVSEVA